MSVELTGGPVPAAIGSLGWLCQGALDGTTQLPGGERFDHPAGGTGAAGQELVGRSIEEKYDRDRLLSLNGRVLSHGAGNGHSAHRGDLKVDDNCVDTTFGGCPGSCCRIVVVDQFKRR
jgi:hypothetical protein